MEQWQGMGKNCAVAIKCTVSSGKVKEQKLSVKVKEQTTQRQGKGKNCSVERYRNKLFSGKV